MATTFRLNPMRSVVDVPEEWWDTFEPPPGARAEIIRGVLSLSPSPRPIHGLVQSQLIVLFKKAMPQGCGVVPGIEWKFAVNGIVAMAPQLDVMVCRWDAEARKLVMPPVLGVEVLSPSDVDPWEGMTRIEGKRLDYAANGLEHYLEVDTTEPAVTRYELRDGLMVAVERVAGDQVMAVSEPFGYSLCPSGLIEP